MTAAAAAPKRITARAALRAGWRDLWRSPAVTALALFGAMVAALAARAAAERAGTLWAAAFADLDDGGERFFGLAARALGCWLAGSSVAALLVDITRAAALCAYAAPPPPDRGVAHLMAPLRLGLVRTPGMISVRAVELLLYFALGLGELFVLARGLQRVGVDPAGQALAVTACLSPAIVIGVVVFAASRVAQALIARGLPPAAALAHGYDVVARRFASLVRLALAGGVATAPILIVALLMPFPLRALLFALAALWLYAALTTLVGRDGRLLTG
jgi:hypothetical protein